MIEFKAECGHTVRAKDESAGGVVRCSYCGREAEVPDDKEDELDFLFREVDQADDGGRGKRKRKSRKSVFRALARGRGGRPFDPFSVVLKLCYVAFLIAAVIFVGRKWVLPLFRSDGVIERIAGNHKKPDEPAPSRTRQRGTATPAHPGRGLMGRDKVRGLYVMSTPPGGTVDYVKADKLPESGRIVEMNGASRIPADRSTPQQRPSAGTYIVEVSFALNNPKLKQFEDYREFRRSVERGTPAARSRLVKQYFLPDEADRVFVDERDGQYFIVRQYADIELRKTGIEGVRALFLPKLTTGDKGAFAIETLVAHHIPPEKHYEFDKANVTDELAYYQVAPADRPSVLEALSRIGVIPYYDVTERVTRLFKIDIEDGSIRAPFLRETEP